MGKSSVRLTIAMAGWRVRPCTLRQVLGITNQLGKCQTDGSIASTATTARGLSVPHLCKDESGFRAPPRGIDLIVHRCGHRD